LTLRRAKETLLEAYFFGTSAARALRYQEGAASLLQSGDPRMPHSLLPKGDFVGYETEFSRYVPITRDVIFDLHRCFRSFTNFVGYWELAYRLRLTDLEFPANGRDPIMKILNSEGYRYYLMNLYPSPLALAFYTRLTRVEVETQDKIVDEFPEPRPYDQGYEVLAELLDVVSMLEQNEYTADFVTRLLLQREDGLESSEADALECFLAQPLLGLEDRDRHYSLHPWPVVGYQRLLRGYSGFLKFIVAFDRLLERHRETPFIDAWIRNHQFALLEWKAEFLHSTIDASLRKLRMWQSWQIEQLANVDKESVIESDASFDKCLTALQRLTRTGQEPRLAVA